MPNGSGKERYSSNWEKLSKELRLYHSCFFCGGDENKECHHIDGDKKNGNPSNVIVLCIECHIKVHSGELVIPETFKGYKMISISLIKANR